MVGDSLFAEILIQMLESSRTVTIIGTASTPKEALPLLDTECLDVVIVTGTGEAERALTPFLTTHPDLPIIRADLSDNYVQLITSRRINARAADLLTVLAELQNRRTSC